MHIVIPRITRCIHFPYAFSGKKIPIVQLLLDVAQCGSNVRDSANYIKFNV